MSAVKHPRIIKDPENMVPVEIFEQSILDVARAFKKIKESNLELRLIVLLLQDSLGSGFISKIQIEAVLRAAARLDKEYLKKCQP